MDRFGTFHSFKSRPSFLPGDRRKTGEDPGAVFAEENIMYDSSQPSRSMQDFVLETNWRLSHAHTDQERDAWLLASVCAVNQFKINMYEMGIGFARSLGWIMPPKLLKMPASMKNNYLINWANWLSEINLALVEPVHITG